MKFILRKLYAKIEKVIEKINYYIFKNNFKFKN